MRAPDISKKIKNSVTPHDNLYRGVAEAIYGGRKEVDVRTKPRVLELLRADGFWLIDAVEMPINKATTAVQFGRPTLALEEAVQRGKLHYFAFDNVLPVQGGLPITIDGEIVGAIGVGGTPTGAEATQCAEVGIAALRKP